MVFGEVGFWAGFREIAKEILPIIYICSTFTVSKEITVEILAKKDATVRFCLCRRGLLKATVGLWRTAGVE